MAPGRRAWRRPLGFLVHAVFVSSAGGTQGASRDAGPAAEPEPSAFDVFVQKHQRGYRRGSSEYESRRLLFEARAEQASAHNGDERRSWTWDAGNRFADRTEEELAAVRAWRGPKVHRASASFLEQDVRSHGHDVLRGSATARRHCALPVEASWAHLNATKQILDQGSCGSCSALSTAVALAAHHEIHHGRSRTFSPQELVSCTRNPEACGGEGGCQGGFMELLMAYVLRHGLQEEHDYPYASGSTGLTGFCRPRTRDSIRVATLPGLYSAAERSPSALFGMVGYERLPINRAEPVMRALIERGPLTVALAAKGWHFYGGGVLDGECEKDAVIDHAVVLLGFGADKRTGKRFWHMQNSWGPDWGESGLVRMARHADEESWCGMDREPQYGAACAKNPDGSRKSMPLEPVEVCGSCGILFNAVVPHFEGASQEAKRLAALRSSCGEGSAK